MKLDFFIPVLFKEENKTFIQNILEITDGYFYFGNKRAVIIQGKVEDGSSLVIVKTIKATKFRIFVVSAIKVATYFTGIIPLLMFLGKIVFRKTHLFQAMPYKICLSQNRIRNYRIDGVIETYQSKLGKEGYWEMHGKRDYPDGSIDRGILDMNGMVVKGYHLSKEGRYTFYYPQLLVSALVGEDGENFVEAEIDGKRMFFPVIGGYQGQYHSCSFRSNEILLKILRHSVGSSLSKDDIANILNHSDEINVMDFIHFILKPNQEMGGSIPIFKINHPSVIRKIIEIAVENKININALQITDPITGFSLQSWLDLNETTSPQKEIPVQEESLWL